MISEKDEKSNKPKKVVDISMLEKNLSKALQLARKIGDSETVAIRHARRSVEIFSLLRHGELRFAQEALKICETGKLNSLIVNNEVLTKRNKL